MTMSFCLSVSLFVRLSVYLLKRVHKNSFSQKLNNLELWSPLTSNRKSYTGFSKKSFYAVSLLLAAGAYCVAPLGRYLAIFKTDDDDDDDDDDGGGDDDVGERAAGRTAHTGAHDD